jgi:hypothetical protein
MYSGIGSFAKKFQQGGDVKLDDGGGSGVPPVGTSGGAGAPMSFEEFVAAYGGNPGGLVGGLAAKVAYQNYLQAFNFSGGNVNVTRGNLTVRPQVLPDYMRINDAGQVVFVEGVTNRQFVEGLKLLGLLDTEHSEGKTDYDWLTEWFTDTNEGGQSDWLNVHLMNPDRQLDQSSIGSGLTSENQATLRRLYDIVNNASTAGGYFTPSQSFLNEYSTPTTPGQNYGNGTAASRPVFIGQPPTGGTAEQPYYSLSDVLVSSSEQPNLYDRFDPYPEGGFERVNPYTGQVTTSYSYRPPTVNVDTGTTAGTDLVFETEKAKAVDPVVDEAEVVNTTQGTGGTGITVDESAVTGTTDTTTATTTPTTSTTDTVETTTVPTGPLSGYQNISAFRDQDPYLFGKRGLVSGLNALAGSRQDLTAEDFASLLSGQQGRYGEGSTLAYDPRFGIYSTISDAELQGLREQQSVPSYIDPRLMTDVERVRSNLTGGGTYTRSVTDEAGNVYKIGGNRQTVRIGDKQYFVNEDGSVTSYGVEDVNYTSSPSFNKGRAETGFAEGGIVDVYSGDMANMRTTGEGIESFLNPERSKATLRRNLAKLAPRPTAPVMQQGIMPMAR